jgi:hypothetical protein
MKFIFFFIFSVLILSTKVIFAQNNIENIQILWLKYENKKYNGIEIKVPSFENQDFNGTKPFYISTKKIAKNTNYSIQILNHTNALANADDLKFLDFFKISIPTKIDFNYKCVNSKNERFVNFSFFPYYKENNVVYKISTLKIEYTLKQNTVQSKKKVFASTSVLSDVNSKWYKIAVTKDGIVKIDKNWLESSGIFDNDVTPNSLHIYGNANGRLSEYNDDYKVDDLAKNATLFVGNSDLIWDENEYLLFYAWGPNKWKRSGDSFRRDLNIYDDNSYYFIRISSSEPVLRINEIATISSPTFSDVTTFNHYDIYEQESKSLVGGGKRWYGDLFDIELSKTISFSIPNVISSSPIEFISSYASIKGSDGSTINYKINSTTLKSTTLNSGNTDYVRGEVTFSYSTSSSSIPLSITVNRNNPSLLTYLDKVELNARRNLIFSGSEINFRDTKSVGLGNISKFYLQNVQNSYFVWDITDRQKPKIVNTTFSNNTFEFIVTTDSLREFVCSNNLNFQTPSFTKMISNQNLHGLGPAKLLIVTHSDFYTQAKNLATLHEGDGLTVHVVTSEQVYNEFSGGSVDPTAIKWFAKMFYDRSDGDVTKMAENLLLFGDGTYDPKNRVVNNNYFIPTYQVDASEDHLNALVTDDYFGMLDDTEAISDLDMMDIGVGRMIVSTPDQAQEMVNKVEQYLREGLKTDQAISCTSPENTNCTSFGDWRLKYVQIADDEEDGYFIEKDTEPQYEIVKTNFPSLNPDKLYLDAYPQVTSTGGDRYPDVYNLISEKMKLGALIINYVGHGGEVGVAEERVITIPQIQSWDNWCNMPLFVSATCEFTKFDDPSRVSAGEWMYLNPKGGAIALMTTTRSVFFGVNTNVGKNFYSNVFSRDQGKPLSFGEIMRRTKNGASASSNKRSFNLIGDPALRIALPELNVFTDSINGHNSSTYVDTLKALSKITIKGHLADNSGTILSNYNGILYPTIFDKKKKIKTLSQDSDSPEIEFEIQKNALFKGKVSVTNGYFTFSFIVPKDINYAYDLGKISYYSNSETTDAFGLDTMVYIGGINPNGIDDAKGPEINMFLNTEKFIEGGLTNENPVLIAKINDENGINMVGNGIGHDITAILDGNTSDPIVLNEYFSNDLDSYQTGKINYQLVDLAPGKHTLALKVWDINNNSSENSIDFVVQKSEFFMIKHVLNYPNPFTTNTTFYFEHNQLCSNLDVLIQIMTISGKLVKTIHQGVFNDCFRSDGISWDGRDDFGDQLAKGVYIYKLSVKNPEGIIAEKLEKLVLLK